MKIVGVALFVAGLFLVMAGNVASKKRIEAEWGELNEVTARLSEGTGVVPKWASGLALLGYLGLAAGVLLVIFG